MDCGKRGNWPKRILLDTCVQCTDERLKHDAIRSAAYHACTGKSQCQRAEPGTWCPTCREYFESASCAFWDTVGRR